jgi:dolichyl-phosphate beta-glucosyltransferase
VPTPRLRLVVPCFNEAERLPADALVAWLDAAHGGPFDAHLLLVDDGSTDATHALLQATAARRPDRIATLRLDRNAGKAEAVRQGLRAALDAGADFTGYWDADLATPLDELAPMFACFDRDPAPWIVMGSRVQLLGRRIERNPLRHYVGRVFATAASLVLAAPVYDTQCGAKLLRTGPWLHHALDRPFVSGWVFDVELLARLSDLLGSDVLHTHVVEHPLLRWTDVQGSKVRPADFPRALLQLGRIVTRDRAALPAPPAPRGPA